MSNRCSRRKSLVINKSLLTNYAKICSQSHARQSKREDVTKTHLFRIGIYFCSVLLCNYQIKTEVEYKKNKKENESEKQVI